MIKHTKVVGGLFVGRPSSVKCSWRENLLIILATTLVLVSLATKSTDAARCTFFEGTPNECKAFFKTGGTHSNYYFYLPDGYNKSYVEVRWVFLSIVFVVAVS